MAKFTDANGKTWDVFIDIPIIKKLRENQLDVLNMFSGKMEVFEQIIGDPVKLVDTMWLVCERQIAERGMDEDGFARSLFGDALLSAADALVEGVCDFFPDPKRRATLRAVLRKSREAEGMMMDRAMAQVEAMDVSEMAKVLEIEFTKTSGELQDLSE